jgi:Holliday junction resolvase RusA-like endonuclease
MEGGGEASLPGETMTTILHLPFPPSTNNLVRSGRGRVYPTQAKKDFVAAADGLQMSIGPLPAQVKGRFTFHLVLNEECDNGRMDADNYVKACLDYAQRVGVIENDRLQRGGSFAWGPCEHGALLSIHPVRDQ